MTGPDVYTASTTALGLPAEWQVTVALRPRRRSLGIEVQPGGTVTVLNPPQADPVEAPAASGGRQLPARALGNLLHARRERPDRVRRAIIELYRREGLAWAVREGSEYERLGRIEGLRYQVRDLGRCRWGVYHGPPKHITALHWAVFGLPLRLIEYVLVHEQAHATDPGGQPHGRAWQRQMTLWMPDLEATEGRARRGRTPRLARRLHDRPVTELSPHCMARVGLAAK